MKLSTEIHNFPITYTGPLGVLPKHLFRMHYDFSIDSSIIISPITIFSMVESKHIIIYDTTYSQAHAYGIEKKEFKNIKKLESFIKKIIDINNNDEDRKHIVQFLISFYPDNHEREYLKLKYL